MRLQTYLLNEGRTQEITKEKAKDILHKNCSDALKTWKKNGNKYIFRGIAAFNKDYGLIDSTSFPERQSRNTSNEYTVLINHILPSWKEYPKRSIICSTGSDYASDYGMVYNIFPYNGTKIGVCPQSDIWSSFAYNLGGHTTPLLNHFLKKLYGVESMNWKELEKSLKKTYMDDIDESFLDKYGFLSDYINMDISLFEVLNKYILNPDENNFELVKSGDKMLNNREIWFDNKALVVKYWKYNYIEEIL